MVTSRGRAQKAQVAATQSRPPGSYQVGVVSDTHGQLRPDLVEAFAGVDLIVHAGDVGEEGVLQGLEAIAPVVAVRGNMDGAPWAARLRRTEVIEIGAVTLYVIHDLEKLGLDPAAARFDAVISGHTHQREWERCDGVLYVNSGTAGPQRPGAAASAALLQVDAKEVEVRFLELVG